MLKETVSMLHSNSRTIDKIFDSYISLFNKEKEGVVLLNYCGEFSYTRIRKFAESVEERMVRKGESRSVTHRVFSVMMQGLNNIYAHGGTEAGGSQKGFLIIVNTPQSYKVLFGNILSKEERSFIKNYIGNINNHSEEELKQLHIQLLKSSFISNEGKTGLGLATMRLKSSKSLEYQIYKLSDEQLFLVIESQIDK
jgi:hypothetical protein